MSHEEKILAELQEDPTPENPTGKLKTGAFNKLSRQESWILINKGTERAFTGDYWNHKADGTYVCRRCNAPLYVSSSKFDSGCGWPSFDDEIPKSVTRVPDVDGHRVEIVCTNCGGHLGHVFLGERFTQKNTRHCVNSVSVKFIPKDQPLPKTIRPKEHQSGGKANTIAGNTNEAKAEGNTENRPNNDQANSDALQQTSSDNKAGKTPNDKADDQN